MGLYSDVIFPRAYDFLMGLARFDAERSRMLARVRGRILEIGIGTGLNLPHYPEGVERIDAVDPNPGMLRKLGKNLRKSRLKVDAVCAGGERLPYPDGSFDTVVSTHVLCSIPDRTATLSEIRRVLRPGGRFVFLEHGLSPDPKIARWQRRLNGIQKRVAAGCLLDVPVRTELVSAGFELPHLDEYYLKKGARTHSYIYDGTAVVGPAGSEEEAPLFPQ